MPSDSDPQTPWGWTVTEFSFRVKNALISSIWFFFFLNNLNLLSAINWIGFKGDVQAPLPIQGIKVYGQLIFSSSFIEVLIYNIIEV